MTISPLAGLSGIQGLGAQSLRGQGLDAQGAVPGMVRGTTATGYLPPNAIQGGTGSADSAGNFGTALSGAIDNVQALSSDANTLAVKAVTGNLDDIHQATLAATRAQVTLELVSSIRNKGVDAFNEIMRMQA